MKATEPRGATPATLSFLCLAIFFHSPLFAAGAWTGRVDAGFDSFTEKYSIVEEDTLDRLSEFRSRVGLGYLQGNLLKDYFHLEGQTSLAESSTELSGRIGLMKRFGESRLALQTELSRKTFRENSDYDFANDYLRYQLRTELRRTVAAGLSLRLSERLEWTDFDRRTEFDYDYLKNSLGFGADYESGFSNFFHASVAFTAKAIPDTTEISYQAYSVGGEFRKFIGLRKHLSLAVNGERRIFESESVKSPFWSVLSSANILPVTWGPLNFSIENIFEGYFYDYDTGAYFSYIENRTALMAMYARPLQFNAGLGPSFGFLASSFSQEDEYTDVGAKIIIEYNSGNAVWLSATYEPGVRNYNAYDGDTSNSIFSDFTYHRLLLFTTVRIWKNASVNLFVDHEPEKHKREGDDSTATLFSIDIAYTF